jgi:hypothetical protein
MGEVIAQLILKAALDNARKFYEESARAEIARRTLEEIRKQMLALVAQEFIREIAYNASQYVRSVGAASVSIEPEGNPGEALERKLQTSIRKFKEWIDSQPNDSPVVSYLLRKYGTTTGTRRSYVGRSSMKPYQTLGLTAKTGYWTKPDKNISEMVNSVAVRIFEETMTSQP